MDYICKFLTLNLCELLFGLHNSCPCESSTVENKYAVKSLERTLRHNYPKRLVTYDADKLNEPRLVRFSDLSESLQSMLKPVTPEEEEIEIDTRCKCFNLCKKLSEQRLAHLEKSSKSLHERYSESQLVENGHSPLPWKQLKPMQKVYFYWQSLTGNKLRPTPYANFKEVFAQKYHEQCPNGSLKQMHLMMRRGWRRLSSDERVPFKLHALLYHVSNGSVNPSDHCAVRLLLNRWR